MPDQLQVGIVPDESDSVCNGSRSERAEVNGIVECDETYIGR